MNTALSVFWPISNNFGDLIGKYIVEKMTGRKVVYAESQADYEHYIFGGSVLNHGGPKSIVWGAGLGTLTDGVNTAMRICAVRGPYSRGRAMACGAYAPKVYGDPGMLLPRFYQPTSKRQHAIGVVPHYVDQFRAYDRYDGLKIIDVFQPIEAVIEEINSCERIFSSSLHGIVVAHAYGIPATWVKISDSIGGDGTKFRDYFASVGMDVPQPIDIRNSINIPSISSEVPTINTDAFWGTCPIPAEFRKPEYR